MRIIERQLRQLIREELDAGSERKAIAVFDNTNTLSTCCIAYEIDALEDSIQDSNLAAGERIRDYWYGVIAGVDLSESAPWLAGHCNGAWHVKLSASSQKGWGTKVYLAALDHLKIISSDRWSVSPPAEAMWKKLARYGFVKQEQFDDIINPQTPPKDDDCQVFKKRDPALDSSWKLTGAIPADIKSLVAAGNDHLRVLEQKGLREKAERALYTGFTKIFEERYER